MGYVYIVHLEQLFRSGITEKEVDILWQWGCEGMMIRLHHCAYNFKE